MKRKEAIQYLEKAVGSLPWKTPDGDKYFEALRMAAEALEQTEKLKKLKRSIRHIKRDLERGFIGECIYDEGIKYAINIVTKHTEGLI